MYSVFENKKTRYRNGKKQMSFLFGVTLLHVHQEIFQLILAHRERNTENDARINMSLKGEIVEGSCVHKSIADFFMGEHLSGNAADDAFPGNSDFIFVEMGNNKIANLLNLDVLLHENAPFKLHIFVLYIYYIIILHNLQIIRFLKIFKNFL